MSRQLIEIYRRRYANESGLTPPPWGGRLSVALVYPNTYHQGMSNLGLQSVYGLLNQRDDSRCERFFLPDPEDLEEHRRSGYPLLSLETQRPLADFDLIAFSISFENDYLNLPVLFDLCQVPFWRSGRDERFPLILCGGVCAFLNPEPLAEVMDLFAIGEAEVILPGLVETLLSAGALEREPLLEQLLQLPGVYVPSAYRVDYDADGCPQVQAQGGAPPRVARQWQDDFDQSLAATVVRTAETEFSEMHLVEVSRGCPRACRFCAAGFIYRPFREHDPAQLSAAVCPEEGAGKVGLVAAAVTDYADLATLGRKIQDAGGSVSVSSVRIDAITPEQVAVLAESGHKTLALAPEVGSQRMRDVINKGIDEQQILAAVQMIAEGGIANLKLYFMVGLPGETLDDVEAIVALTRKIRETWETVGRARGRLGRLILSINPFVPKPWTPLQWAPMEARSQLEKKYRLLQKAVRSLPNVDLNMESLRSAELQGLLARGDRRVAQILPAMASGKNLKAACREQGLDPGFYLSRERGETERFPWEIIDQTVTRAFLRGEYQAAKQARAGRVCQPGCRRCGLSC